MLLGVVVALVCLASYRITRLLVRDTFPPLAVQRARIGERWGDSSWQAYLASCSWCAGVYVSGAVTLATWLIVGLAAPALVWGAAATIVGILGQLDYLMDRASDLYDLRIGDRG